MSGARHIQFRASRWKLVRLVHCYRINRFLGYGRLASLWQVVTDGD